MFIYVVRSGDTLNAIAQDFGSSILELQELNGLEGSDLTTGISLLVPGPPATMVHHTVDVGETLTTIARQYGIPVQAVSAANALLPTEKLEIGQILFVPAPVQQKRKVMANGYLIPSNTQTDVRIINESQPLSYITIFSYRVNLAGDIIPLPAQHALDEMHKQSVMPLLCVTNFDGANFNTELAHSILASATLRQKVTIAIEQQLAQQGFHGVNIDFEHMRPADRPLYNTFLQELVAYMHPRGYSVSIAMGPKTRDEPQAAWMGAFDYKTLGATVDFLMLMTYEWGWVGGPPMAIAPLNQVRAVLEYATSVIKSEKILMGMATYGYNWSLPDTKNNLATGISPNRAQNMAIERHANVRFNPLSASPMFQYTIGTHEHEIWYEDPRSIMAKLHLVYEMNLGGVSLWVLGQPFPQMWRLLADTFTIA